MTVEIIDVQRVNGRAVTMLAQIGDIEVGYFRPKGSNEPPQEVCRLRYGVQVLDIDTLSISKTDYRELQDKLNAIFGEDRSKSRPRKKKFPSELQKQLI